MPSGNDQTNKNRYKIIHDYLLCYKYILFIFIENELNSAKQK